MIQFSCPTCSQTLLFQDEGAGSRARCPRCKEVVRVPGDPEPKPVQKKSSPPKVETEKIHPRAWLGAIASLPVIVAITFLPGVIIWQYSKVLAVIVGVCLTLGLFFLILKFGDMRIGMGKSGGFSWTTAFILLILFWPAAIVYAIVTTQNTGKGGKTKTCPFCAERVKKKAIVCKHCGRDLPEPLT